MLCTWVRWLRCGDRHVHGRFWEEQGPHPLPVVRAWHLLPAHLLSSLPHNSTRGSLWQALLPFVACILASLRRCVCVCGPQAAVGGPRPALPCHAVLCEQPQQRGHGASSGHAHAFSCLPILECHSSCSRQCTRAASSCPVLPGEGHRGLHERHRLQVPVLGPRWAVLPCCIWFSVGVLGPMLGCLCATFFPIHRSHSISFTGAQGVPLPVMCVRYLPVSPCLSLTVTVS